MTLKETNNRSIEKDKHIERMKDKENELELKKLELEILKIAK
jgi:hypothetical protein